MPRSMSEFLVVDFRTGEETSWTGYSMAGSLMAWQTALHEYLGMFFMGLLGEGVGGGGLILNFPTLRA